MSMQLAALAAADPKKRSRKQLLALHADKVYDDGRTKQSFADETNIQKILARADRAGTISHLEKFEGVYGDFSDFDFHKETEMIARGGEIFAALNAELRQEFGQDPAKFFAFVNKAENVDQLHKLLPALALPGRQLLKTSPLTADEEKAAVAAASELVASEQEKSVASLANAIIKAQEETKEG